jgi:hypothetical protein
LWDSAEYDSVGVMSRSPHRGQRGAAAKVAWQLGQYSCIAGLPGVGRRRNIGHANAIGAEK